MALVAELIKPEKICFKCHSYDCCNRLLMEQQETTTNNERASDLTSIKHPIQDMCILNESHDLTPQGPILCINFSPVFHFMALPFTIIPSCSQMHASCARCYEVWIVNISRKRWGRMAKGSKASLSHSQFRS